MSEVHVSDTARVRLAEEFSYLPTDAAETLGGWLTLIEECDERWRQRWYPDPTASTAVNMRDGLEYMSPRQQADERHTWQQERGYLIRGAADLLALYPRPMFVTR